MKGDPITMNKVNWNTTDSRSICIIQIFNVYVKYITNRNE